MSNEEKSKINRLEDKFQVEVVKWLQEAQISFFAVNNEASGNNPRRMAYLKAMGLKSGVSDLVLILKDKVIFLELKSDTGKQSQSQLDFQAMVERLGHKYLVLRPHMFEGFKLFIL